MFSVPGDYRFEKIHYESRKFLLKFAIIFILLLYKPLSIFIEYSFFGLLYFLAEVNKVQIRISKAVQPSKNPVL